MPPSNRLLDHYLPPQEGFLLESLVATTYLADFEFLEEELLPAALGVRAPTSRMRAFRSELERRLQQTDVTVLYDLAGCERLARLSPRIDALPVSGRKLHAKVTVQTWVRPAAEGDGPADRRLRLVVGSANLTRYGFRENYECVAALEYGGRNSAPPGLLREALAFLRDISGAATSKQLERQLAQMEGLAASLPDRTPGEDEPVKFVAAGDVLPALREVWAGVSGTPPATVHVVSPFWPEGDRAGEALAVLVGVAGVPRRVELLCRGAAAADGRSWIPEFDAAAASVLRERLGCPVQLRAALPDHGALPAAEPDEGDETEEYEIARQAVRPAAATREVQRALHAKLVALSGPQGTVLYMGSSNATRRGMGLGGPTNWEAGFVYRLGPKRILLKDLLAFAGERVEVLPGVPVVTRQPEQRIVPPAPNFLSEVTVEGTVLTIRFRAGEPVPVDLHLLMEDAGAGQDRRYWVLYRAADPAQPGVDVKVDLTFCPRCDASGVVVAEERPARPVPHVQVEVRWQGLSVAFPVRFLNKAELPLLLLGRKPSEGELIDYFLFGREPAEGEEAAEQAEASRGGADDPLDTRHILAYFMRRFVQAIPGIEAEVGRAAYSRSALEAALRGPTSPLALAEHAAASLDRPPAAGEPAKTPTAVGFQLVEIAAALSRSQGRVEDPELTACFPPVIDRCRSLLDRLAAAHTTLAEEGFKRYRSLLGEGVL
jgi:hypothetical protein